MTAETRTESELAVPPTTGKLLRVWLALGAQSFGGGVATLALIRQAVVERHQWVSEEEFMRTMALTNLAPGINLFALSILLGRRIAGTRGIFICLLGLMLPSAGITILLTGVYARLRHFPEVQAAINGILPVTLGLGLLVSLQMVRPLLVTAHKEGKINLCLCFLLLVCSGALAMWGRWPVFLILLAAGGIGAAFSVGLKALGARHGEEINEEGEREKAKGESDPQPLNP
jgi:chromate transporter